MKEHQIRWTTLVDKPAQGHEHKLRLAQSEPLDLWPVPFSIPARHQMAVPEMTLGVEGLEQTYAAKLFQQKIPGTGNDQSTIRR